ncbi:hypothetical protein [Actinoplanes sandaracinus]|nr:hypothetical protein [Actinoplanes sandaracinus]
MPFDGCLAERATPVPVPTVHDVSGMAANVDDQGTDQSVTPSPKPPRSVNRSDWEWALMNCPDVELKPKAVAIMVSRFADFETGRNAHPSQAKIAAMCGYSKTEPVSNILSSLRDDGWLYRDGKGPTLPNGRANDRYRLTVPDCGHEHDGSALPDVLK